MISSTYQNPLPTPSDEQQEIIINFLKGYNIKIEAVAGAGKTTTLLLLADQAKRKFNSTTLILTYNRDLKDEIAQRIIQANLQHYCQVYTYHGYASKIYATNICNDTRLREHLVRNPKETAHRIVLLDEVQDMNADYHTLVNKILSHGKILVIVGDRRQCINEYLGANCQYLLEPENYFDTGRPWKLLSLKTSYRLTPCLAKFVNTLVLNEDIIIGGNIIDKDLKPMYSYGLWEIKNLMGTMVKDYGAEEVVIIMPSVKNIHPKSPVGILL